MVPGAARLLGLLYDSRLREVGLGAGLPEGGGQRLGLWGRWARGPAVILTVNGVDST